MYATQFDYAARALRLNDISTINANGRIFQKLDLLAVVTVNSAYTVNVYRRYNSDFNIVIEDCYGNLSFHQDESMYVTLKNRFGLSDVEVSSMYVSYFYSFKHGTVLNYIPCSIFTMKWSDIQDSYSALDLAIVYQPSSSRQQEVNVEEPSVKSEESSSESDSDSDSNSDSESELSDNNPDLQEEKEKEEKPYNSVVYYATATPFASATPFATATPFANIFVNVHTVPLSDDDTDEENNDGCCSRICKKRSFCAMKEESESEEVEEEEEEVEEEEEDDDVEVESDDESRYTVLRNGTKFRKKD